MPRELTADELVKIANRYRTGESAADLAAEFGMHRTTMNDLLRKLGVEPQRKRTVRILPDAVEEARRKMKKKP